MDKRYLYKLELACVKYTPIIISLINLLNIVLSFLAIGSTILDSIAGSSVLTVIPMYISSYVYKFCKYHRMFINYILINNLLDLYDEIIGIPLSDMYLLMIYLIIASAFSFVILYLYLKYGDRQDK